MIINSLKIYGFGKLSDLEISFTEGINVVEGRNEAGKSTLMAFIKAVLFGFASRRNPHERYEPLGGGKFGGILYLTDSAGEKYSIERVFNQKVAGDLIITLPTGELAGEELLPAIIGNINESTFRQVFSFDLRELQQLEFLSDEQINDFIYHVGTGSVNQILDMKKELAKHKDNLYKAGGSKPLINLQLTALDKLAEEIRQLEIITASYGDLQREIDELTQLITLQEANLADLESELTTRGKYAQAQPTYLALERADLALASYPADFSFPEDGVRRLEEAKLLVKRLNDQENELKLRIANLSSQLVDLSSLEGLEDQASEILRLKSELVLYTENTRLEHQLSNQLDNNNRSINDQLRLIGGGFSLEWVNNFELTVQEKDWLQNSYDDLTILKGQIDEQERDLERTDLEQQEILNAVRALELEEERQTAENPLLSEFPTVKHYWGQLRDKRAEKRNREDQLNLYEDQQQTEKPGLLAGNLLLLVLSAAVAGAIYYYSDSVFAGAIALLLGAVGVVVFHLLRSLEFKNRTSGIENHSKRLRSQLATIGEEEQDLLLLLEDSLARLGGLDLTEATYYALEQKYNDEYADQLIRRGERKRVRELENEILNLATRRDFLEAGLAKERAEYKQQQTGLEDWLVANGLPVNLNYNALNSLITRIEKIQDEVRLKAEREQELARIREFKREYEAAMLDLREHVPVDNNPTVDQFINLAADRLQFYRDSLVKNQSTNERLQEAKDALEQGTLARETDLATLANLLTSAKAADEEEFYSLAKLFDEFSALQDQRREAELTLKLLAGSDDKYQLLLADLKELEFDLNQNELEALQAKRDEIKAQIKASSERKGALVSSQNKIETDARLAELKFEYEQASTKLKSLSKEWLAYAYSESLLDQTMRMYEEEKQPAILLTATDLFSRLTDGEYTKIISSIGSNELRVIRKDNRQFEPQFLSRGTLDQLFLALRYAIVKEYSKQQKLPLILDDIFVNFDEKRLDNALDIVLDFAREQQVIIFTCHPHLTNRLKKIDKNVYNVKLA